MRTVPLLVIAAGTIGLLTAPAQAATVGQAGTPNECDGPNLGQVQTATAGPPAYTIPTDGTVTSFSAGTQGAGPQTKLLILQPVSGDTYQVVAKSDFGTFTVPGGVQTFSTQIPVRTGEVIGQYGQVCDLPSMAMGDTFSFFTGPEPITGTNQSFPNPSGPRIDISATVEPATSVTPVTPGKKKCKKHKKKHHSAVAAKRNGCHKKKHR